MPPLDTSIALQAKAPEMSNPLEMMLKVGQYKYLQQNSNKLQKDMDSNEAVSKAIQASTGPDGKVNMRNVQSLIASDPSAAYNLQAATGTNLAQTGQQIGNDTAQIGQQGAQLQLTQAQRSDLVRQTSAALGDPDLSYAKVVDMATANAKANGVPDAVLHQVISNLPPDKAGLQQVLKAKLNALQEPGAALGTYMPATGSVATGGGTTMTNTDKMSGAVTPTATFQNTLSAGDAAAQVEVTKPDGTKILVPKAEVLRQQGMGGILPQQGNPQAGGSGRYPGNTGAFQTAPAAGTVEASAKANAAGGDILVADRQANAESGKRINMLTSAADALTKAQTGTGADKLQSLRGVVAMLGGPAEAATDYDKANKYLTQYASAKANGIGNGTDAQLAATVSGNANTKIANLASQDVVKVNLGLERMEQARLDAFERTKSDYGKWKSQFGATMDPRVFVADQIDLGKAQKMYSAMKPEEQAKFKAQYNWALQNGYITGHK
jgi:uncharacterized tellurite resistance protein B-like protein